MTRVGQLYRETLVNHIKEGVDENSNVFLISYSKVSSVQASELRKDLKKIGADVYVSKNSVAQIALKELEQKELAERIDGQTAFVWSTADSVAVSKILVKFSEDIKTVTVQGGLLDGRLIEEADVIKLSSLPSREVLLAQLLGTIQAPLTRLAGALNAKSRELLSILKQLSEKQGGNE